jgi:hypothetical protein
VRARDRLGHRGQGSVDPAVVLEALVQNVHRDNLAPVLALEHRPGHGESAIAASRASARSAPRGRRKETEVGLVNQLRGSLTGPRRQPARRVRLQAPENPLAKEPLVARPRLLTEDFPVPPSQLGGGHVAEFINLLLHALRHVEPSRQCVVLGPSIQGT